MSQLRIWHKDKGVIWGFQFVCDDYRTGPAWGQCKGSWTASIQLSGPMQNSMQIAKGLKIYIGSDIYRHGPAYQVFLGFQGPCADGA